MSVLLIAGWLAHGWLAARPNKPATLTGLLLILLLLLPPGGLALYLWMHAADPPQTRSHPHYSSYWDFGSNMPAARCRVLASALREPEAHGQWGSTFFAAARKGGAEPSVRRPEELYYCDDDARPFRGYPHTAT